MKSYVFPGDIDPAIMAIGAEPIPYMRTQAFSDINLESERILLDLIGCKGGRTIIYTGSGTGAMSAVVENYVTTRRKALVIDGGSFGHRWWDLCRYYGVEQIHYEVPFARDIDYTDLEKTVAEGRPDVFLCQGYHIAGKKIAPVPLDGFTYCRWLHADPSCSGSIVPHMPRLNKVCPGILH